MPLKCVKDRPVAAVASVNHAPGVSDARPAGNVTSVIATATIGKRIVIL
jgi:hypothetical protein